jgi:glucose-6-phosphate dehydrogenase assembly protein OpcA
MIELTDTNSSAIAAEFVAERSRHGSPAMGMVMTMLIVVDEATAAEALMSARHASHEHPARVLGVILGDGRGKPTVNAQIGVGDEWTGEVALIRLSGEVVKHADSVVSPLLLPDSPVVVWWPNDHPDDPASDPIGALAQRRITDAAAVSSGRGTALHRLCESYAPGTTDLAWTRLTPWRALLAAAFDQKPLKVRSATVTAEKISPSADLLSAWLADRLKVKVARETSAGPGITDVVLDTAEGDIQISRKDGKLATFRTPGNPDRPMALKRRDVAELLAEELRRLDEDDIYAATAKKLVASEAGRHGRAPAKKQPPAHKKSTAGVKSPTRGKPTAGAKSPARRKPAAS